MIAALSVFTCTIAIAIADGYAGAGFAPVVLADAARAAAPLFFIALLGSVPAAMPPLRRYGHLLVVASLLLQSAIVFREFGWWWIEPHATLSEITGTSLAARWWLTGIGLLLGAAIAALTRRCRAPSVAADVWLGVAALFLLGGGRVYRSFDHVEAGHRLLAAMSILAAAFLLGLVLYRLLRDSSAKVRSGLAVTAVIAVLAPLLAGRAVSGALPPGHDGSCRDSVLLVVVDTLRADAADRDWSGKAPLMPQLDRIASSGTRFTQAIAPAPWTLPSTLSIVSGWNPHRHRAGRSTSDWRAVPGDPAASYLGPALRDSGYQVAAFVHNPYLRPFYGFGFGHLLFRPYHGRAADGAALLEEWLASHDRRPFFAMFHVMDPHWPYKAVPGFGAPRNACAQCDSLLALGYNAAGPLVRSEVRKRYNAEVSYTDSVLGELYDTLARQGILDHTWLIVTSDHGEEFWDHGGFLHGHQLYDELLHVPLVVVPPVGAAGFARGRRAPMQVRLEDIAATVLDVAGADQTMARDGSSLLPLLKAAAPSFAQAAPRTEIAGYIKSPTDLRYAVRQYPFKAIFGQDEKIPPLLFDLRTDPLEKIVGAPAALRDAGIGAIVFVLQQLKGAPDRAGVDVHREPLPAHDGAALDVDTRRQLRSLGYLN